MPYSRERLVRHRATVLDLIRQDLDRAGYSRHSATLTNLCQEPAELQNSCRIEIIE